MRHERSGQLWLALAAALLLLLVLAGYYLVHKPLTPAQALTYLDTLGSVTVAILLTVLGGGLGRRLLRRLPAADAGTRVVVALSLGWGVLALGVLLLGLLRLLFAAWLWGVALFLIAWLRQDVKNWLADGLAAARALAPAGSGQRLLAGYVGLVLILGGLQAAAPPLKWDALVYHLALPRLYAQRHSVYVPLDEFSLFTGMPQLGEMLYTAATLLRLDPDAGSVAAQLLGWVAGGALALGLAAAAHGQGWPAWLAPAILFSSFTIASALAWAYVEMLLMLLTLAMLLALVEWRRHRTFSWMALAGVLGGLAFGCKYTGFIVPLGGLAIVADTLGRCPESGGSVRRAWLPAGVFVLAAAMVGAPWLIKNWILTGSPIYPLLFPAADMDAARLWFYNRPDLAERSPLNAVLIFWRAAFLGVQGGNDFDITLGPLLVVLPLFLGLCWRYLPVAQRANVRGWVVFAGVTYLAWVLLVFQSKLAEQARLFLAAAPVLAVLGTAGWAALGRLDTPVLRISRVAQAALVLVLGLSMLELVHNFVALQPLAYLTGRQSPQEYSFNRLGWYTAALEGVNALPRGARVMFLWEARSLDCGAHVRCVPDVVIDRWWHLRRTGTAVTTALDGWQAEGVTHVLVYETGLAFTQAQPTSPFSADDWAALADLRSRLRVVATFGGDYTLYALP